MRERVLTWAGQGRAEQSRGEQSKADLVLSCTQPSTDSFSSQGTLGGYAF